MIFGLLYFVLATLFHISVDGFPASPFFNGAATKAELEKAGIIPDVLGDFDPVSEIRVIYPKIGRRPLEMGEVTFNEETKEAPEVWFSKTNDESQQQYTLMLLDPDAIEGWSPYLHWMVTNIDGDLTTLDIDSPIHQYAPYVPPAPPAGSGIHRYIFAVYEQPQINQAFKPAETPERKEFDAFKFVTENGLKPVGAFYMLQGPPPTPSTSTSQ